MADSVDNIVSRLGKRFNNASGERDKPDYLTRDIGGHFRNNQPYISGYFQVIFGLPQELFMDETHAKTASQWLHSTCENFQPHTQALNKVDIQGQGQIGSSFVASVTTTREFTMAFREYQNLLMLNIIRQWASVFDPFTGVSPLDGNRFIPQNYKGWCAVAQTKPVGSRDAALNEDDIEECYIYQGVFPTTIPVDTGSASDITTNDTVQHSITFSFDGAPLTSNEPGVTAKVVELLKGMQYIGDPSEDPSTYSQYINQGLKASQWGSADGEVKTNVAPEVATAAPNRIK